MNHIERGVTAIGLNYIDSIIFDLLKKSYEVYKAKDFSKKQSSVSINENKYASAGIVLVAIGIESYRNLIFYGEIEKITRSVADDFCRILKKKDKNIPTDFIKDSIIELFIVRDIIVHSHVYRGLRKFDNDSNLISERYTLLKDQYGDRKLFLYSNSRTKKTNTNRLNIQPIRIGFEDYFKILIILDMLIGIISKYWGKNIVRYHPLFEIDNYWFPNLAELYAYFYDRIPNDAFKRSLKKIIINIRKSYLPFMESSDSFIDNICWVCNEPGFKKQNRVYSCLKCGNKVEFSSTYTKIYQGKP